MSIRFAILALLSEHPMHGYGIKGVLTERVGALWPITTAQVYQSLGRMELAGLVAGRTEANGRRPSRRVYSLTDAGRSQLGAWLGGPPTSPARICAFEVFIRALCLREEDAPVFWRSLVARQRALIARLRDTAAAGSHASAIFGSGVDVTGAFVEAALEHIETDLMLVRHCRRAVERWASARRIPLPVEERFAPTDDASD